MCEYCDRAFIENLDGLIEMTFHTLIRHGTDVNGPDYEDEFVKFTSEKENKAKVWFEDDEY